METEQVGFRITIGHGFFQSLISSSGFQETIFNRRMTAKVLHSSCWTPITCYILPPKYPHVMFTMIHGIVGDKRLLRGEVIAILSAMRTRLDLPSLADHLIIPVCSSTRRSFPLS
jgi:hypothetical protein